MTYDRQKWCETAVRGLHVRIGAGPPGVRLLGWPGVLPFSVIRSVELAIGTEQPSPRAGVSSPGHKEA
ncbi:hypothetical protein SUDANB105_07657 [Streptomyces sp. enrichment culture]|uniref:hypothetical protein n=1 Tax=Streptomyces sp. enrichment culture TaxID=1795815 RepID=UPI003F57351F